MKLEVNHTIYDVSRDGDQLSVNGVSFATRVDGEGRGRIVIVNGRPYEIELRETDGSPLIVRVDGTEHRVAVAGARRAVTPAPLKPVLPPAAGSASGVVLAPMAGRILQVAVETGERIEPGALLVVLEAMKMQNEIRAPHAASVKAIDVHVGQRVIAGQRLLMLE